MKNMKLCEKEERDGRAARDGEEGGETVAGVIQS